MDIQSEDQKRQRPSGQESGLDGTQDSGIGEEININGGGEAGGEKERLRRFTFREVSNHCEDRSCWLVLYDHVYDVTEFLHEHPGGKEIIMEHAGGDGTGAFRDKRHSTEAHDLLKQYCIGKLVESECIYGSDKCL